MSPASSARERQQLVVRDDVVHQAEPQRFLGIDEVAGERHLDRAAQADPLRQQHGDATTGHDPDARVGVGEAGPLRRDQERALQRELEPAGHRDPVDRADDRLRDHRDEPVEPVRVPLGALARRPWLVGGRDLPLTSLRSTPGAERGIGAGERPPHRRRDRRRRRPPRPTARAPSARLNALRASGRLSVMVAMRSSTSTSRTGSSPSWCTRRVDHGRLRGRNRAIVAYRLVPMGRDES